MNVKIDWCVRITKCRYCEEDIPKDAPLLVWIRKWKNGWINKNYYHPLCWHEERMYYLEDRPKPVFNGGRKKKTGSDEDRKRRKVLINRYNRLKKNYKPSDGMKMTYITMELALLGGIPPSWG